MALVPFKNILQFPQKKCDKHLKIDKKDLSWVAKFVSHNGNMVKWNMFPWTHLHQHSTVDRAESRYENRKSRNSNTKQ